MTYETRAPGAEDVDPLARLHVATWIETYADQLPSDFFTPELLERRRAMWDRIVGNPRADRQVQVATFDGALVGFAFAGPPVSDGPAGVERELYSIYVSRDHHGSGVAQSLLDRTLGDGPAFLWVAEHNPRAQAFYRRNGFELDGAHKVDPVMPDLPHVRMVR